MSKSKSVFQLFWHSLQLHRKSSLCFSWTPGFFKGNINVLGNKTRGVIELYLVFYLEVSSLSFSPLSFFPDGSPYILFSSSFGCAVVCIWNGPPLFPPQKMMVIPLWLTLIEMFVLILFRVLTLVWSLLHQLLWLNKRIL